MKTHVIETVLFTLAADADPIAFKKAAEAVSEYVKACRGFVARRLSCAEDGTWIEHIEWQDLEAAQAAAAGIGNAPSSGPFLEAINGSSVKMLHSTLEVSVN